MKQLRPFTITLFIIVWLVACVQGDESVEETAVAPAITPVFVPTSTPTNHELLPTRPASLPAVSIEADVEYRLNQPPFESLLEVMRRQAEFEDIHLDEYWGNASYNSIYKMIEADLANFYDYAFPDQITLLNDVSLRSQYFGWYQPPPILLELLENSVLLYLNQTQQELMTRKTIEEEYFKLTPFFIELDNDLTPKLLIQFDSFIFQARIFLLLDQNENGQYEIIPSSLPTFLGRSYFDNVKLGF